MEKLCAAIGFTKEMIESLLTKKEAIRCNGRIYSEEHRRKFDIKNDIFKVERNPTDNNKLVLTINRQPIGEWFKEQCKKQVFDQQFSEKLVSADFGKQLLHILIDKAVMRQRAAASLLGA